MEGQPGAFIHEAHEDRNSKPPDDSDQLQTDALLAEEDERKREELDTAPMQAELIHLEKRWTMKGRPYITEPWEEEDLLEEKSNWYERFVLCVIRRYDPSNRLVEDTSLQVNSPALKRILKEVIGSYPGVSFDTSTISIKFPLHCLYHYLPELTAEKARLEVEDPESDDARHLPILLDFINEHFRDVISESGNLREQGLISYEHLWTIFKPGSLVYTVIDWQPRVYKLKSYSYAPGGSPPGLRVNLEFVDFDGNQFGTRGTWVMMPPFVGITPICALNVFPLQFSPSEADVRGRLIERGRRWEAHAGQRFRQYSGIALDSEGKRVNIDSRVMIDARTVHRIEANRAFNVSRLPKIGDGKKGLAVSDDEMKIVPTDNNERLTSLTEEQCLVATPIVRGFSMTEKIFLDFFIDNIYDIAWNGQCFEQLVLPETQKDLVQALVHEHTRHSTEPDPGFDGIYKGTSSGLVLVLHGPPGVGKTLTAECVAESSKRPLYMLSPGDLDTDPSKLEEQLSLAFDLASTWKAVLLVDEADVFLERRSPHDIQGNRLVSIFLRALESFSGVLFMTTRRVQAFDDAFKSRIHVPLKYGELPPHSRARIWRDLLRGAGEGVVEGVDDAGYETLAAVPLNGRQIKNVVSTAKSLISHKKCKLGLDQLKQVMELHMTFDRDMSAAEQDVGTAMR